MYAFPPKALVNDTTIRDTLEWVIVPVTIVPPLSTIATPPGSYPKLWSIVHVVAGVPCVCLYCPVPLGITRLSIGSAAVPVIVAAATPVVTVPTVIVLIDPAGPGFPGAETLTTSVAPSMTVVAVLVLVTVTVSEL